MWPIAHIVGIPVEETLGTLGPAILIVGTVLMARVRRLVRMLTRFLARRARAL